MPPGPCQMSCSPLSSCVALSGCGTLGHRRAIFRLLLSSIACNNLVYGPSMVRVICAGAPYELAVQLVEQRLGFFQVGGVEPLREPVVNFCEHRARLVATALFCEQPRQAHRRTQLKRFCALPAREFDCITKASSSFFYRPFVANQ